MKALKMLKTSQTVAQRAESFLESIKRNIQRDVLDEIKARIEKLKDSIFSLSDFTLDTDHNKGVSAISREDAEQRFKQIIEAEYELELLELEMKAKQDSFDKYFKTEANEESVSELSSGS